MIKHSDKHIFKPKTIYDTIIIKKTCKFWINFEKEYNCSLISIYLHEGMTLKQIGERLGVSAVRIKQIQDKALKKINLLSEFDVLRN